MRILLVGATGTIGRAILASLPAHHDVVPGSRHSSPICVDLTSPESVDAMYRDVKPVDAVICAAGQTRFAPLSRLTDADFEFSIANTLLTQVRLVRLGIPHFSDHESFTLTGGTLAHSPMVGGARGAPRHPGQSRISSLAHGDSSGIRHGSITRPRSSRLSESPPSEPAPPESTLDQFVPSTYLHRP